MWPLGPCAVSPVRRPYLTASPPAQLQCQLLTRHTKPSVLPPQPATSPSSFLSWSCPRGVGTIAVCVQSTRMTRTQQADLWPPCRSLALLPAAHVQSGTVHPRVSPLALMTPFTDFLSFRGRWGTPELDQQASPRQTRVQNQAQRPPCKLLTSKRPGRALGLPPPTLASSLTVSGTWPDRAHSSAFRTASFLDMGLLRSVSLPLPLPGYHCSQQAAAL